MKFSEYKEKRKKYCECNCYGSGGPYDLCAECEEFEEIDEPIICDVCGADVSFASDESIEADQVCLFCGFNKKRSK